MHIVPAAGLVLLFGRGSASASWSERLPWSTALGLTFRPGSLQPRGALRVEAACGALGGPQASRYTPGSPEQVPAFLPKGPRAQAGTGDSSAPPPTDACSPPDGPHPAPSLGRREGPRPSTVPYRERALKWMTAAAEWLPQEVGFLQGPGEHSAPGQSPQLLGGRGEFGNALEAALSAVKNMLRSDSLRAIPPPPSAATLDLGPVTPSLCLSVPHGAHDRVCFCLVMAPLPREMH